MIAFITRKSNLVPLLEGLCSSNPCRFELSVFGVFARNEPTTSGLTVPRSDHLTRLVLHRLGYQGRRLSLSFETPHAS